MSEPTQAPLPHCAECGAPSVNSLSCWEMLGALLAWEYDDPQLQAEHFLTVASYNVQHPAQLSEATLAGLRAVYIGGRCPIQGLSIDAQLRVRMCLRPPAPSSTTAPGSMG